MKVGFRDILDGTANTIMLGEINTDLGDFHITTMFYNFGTGDIRLNPSLCKAHINPARPRFWTNPAPAGAAPLGFVGGTQDARGWKWANAQVNYSGFLTVLAPNREICTVGNTQSQGNCPASSRHQGGCHVLMADGAVKYITESIEAGDPNNAMVRMGGSATPEPTFPTVPGSKSPYGLWGALGTRANAETLSAAF
jgi:prepilin-type processing-associated H-X9-DG protein